MTESHYHQILPGKPAKHPSGHIGFANVGSGVGVFRTTNGPMVEFNTLSGLGVDINFCPDDRTISIDATKLVERIDILNTKYNTLSTAILSAEASARHGDSILKSRLGQLEARPGYVLPQALAELAQMPRFHGSVPVIQNGKWAALNLSNDFFNKYEAKMDACVAVGGDVQRSVKDYTAQVTSMREAIAQLQESARLWQGMVIILGIITVILSLRMLI